MSNVPPESGIRVPAEAMRDFVQALFLKTGMLAEDADLMSRILVDTDLRGVFSHGTQAAAGYVRRLLDGRVNPRPRITIARETVTTRSLDGDGGMGHMPAHQAMQWVVKRAREHGMAAATTRNHFHFGAAGTYSRLALAHACIGIATSSHRYALRSDEPRTVMAANGKSPLSIAIPAGAQPPLVLDMATNLLPWDDALFAKYPFAYFRSLGLAATMQALGGILAGIYRPELAPPRSSWESNQGAFVVAIDVSRFISVVEFKAEMDRYIGDARSLRALSGQEHAELAGGLEWRHERDYSRQGIPIGERHRAELEAVAAEVGIEAPFAGFEHTRFGTLCPE